MVIADNRTVGPTLLVHLHSTVKSSLDLSHTPYLLSIAYISIQQSQHLQTELQNIL